MGSNQKGYKPLVDMDYKMWGLRACVRPVYTLYIKCGVRVRASAPYTHNYVYIFTHGGVWHDDAAPPARAPPTPALQV